MKKTTSKRTGLVLSGGGIRGMAHIGFIKALQEHNIPVDAIAGSSIGALVGALFANGNSTDEMLAFFKETPMFQYNFFTFNKPGLIDTDKYFKIFKSHFPENNFESLQKKLYVVATDLLNGEEVVFDDGELIPALLASAALPPVFSPVEINGSFFADGGIMNNFPKEYLDDSCDLIIGSNVSVIGKLEKKDIKNAWQLGTRVTSLAIYASTLGKLEQCDLCIEPKKLEHIGVFDKKSIETAFRAGYEQGGRAIGKYLDQTSS